MSVGTDNAWRAAADGSGVLVRVRLTPKASSDAVEGVDETPEGPALKARVRAVPEDGKANAALAALVASWLELPKRSVTVTQGLKSRIKTLAVTGDPADLIKRLETACAPPAANARQNARPERH